MFETYFTEIATVIRHFAVNTVEMVNAVTDIAATSTFVATIAAADLSNFSWKLENSIDRGYLGTIELKLLSVCTTMHDDNKLKNFCITSKGPHQDV